MDFYLVGTVLYNGRRFNIFEDSNFRKTFLEVINDKFSYVDYKTYLELDRLYNKKTLFYRLDGKRKKYNFIPKIMMSIGGAVMAVALTISGVNALNNSSSNVVMPHNLFDKNEIIMEDGYTVDEGMKRIYVYSADRLTDFLPEEYKQNPTYDQLVEAVKNNQNIDDSFKPYYYDFIEKLKEANLNIDLRPFYMNIKTVSTGYMSEVDLKGISQGSASQGIFMAEYHNIYVNSEASKEMLDFVIPHEIGHTTNNVWFDYKGYTVIRDFCKSGNYGYIIEEGMDSLFVDTLYGFNPEVLPYRIINNHSQNLINSTDYNFETYINGSIIDYQKTMDDAIDQNLVSDYNFDGYLNSVSSATLEYHFDEYDKANYTDLDEISATLFFDNKLNENCSFQNVIDAYNEYINNMVEQNNKGVFMNIDTVNSIFVNTLERKNIPFEVDDILYTQDTLPNLTTNTMTK